jgi:hypothetical protein
MWVSVLFLQMQSGDFIVAMYKKLLPLVNRFVYLRQGYFNRYYEGKLLEVTPDTLTIQAYDDQGRPEAEWVMTLSTVTEFMVGDRDLDELNIKVCLAKTVEQAELNDSAEAYASFERMKQSVTSKTGNLDGF